MLTQFARARARSILDALAGFFLRLGLSPNALTILGFVLVCATAIVIGAGHEALGGVLLIFALIFDAVDGSAARLSGRESKFGAFLDSTLDRWAEAALYFALLVRAWERNDLWLALLVFAAFASSVMVSYTRARAEGIGVECKEGILTRFERLALLILGLLLTSVWDYLPLQIIIALIAALSTVTAVQRIWHVYRALQK